MKIQSEDIIFGTLALISIGIWLLSVIYFDYPLLSVLFLWSTMILITILYIHVYKKRKRDKKIMKLRFYLSGIPVYPSMIYYIYKLIFDNGVPKEQELLPLYVLIPALAINGFILLFFDILKK
jgi:hypothetical protein